ncbi:hypothetical protein [Mesorhizobium sp.]|uniref:hypothetical protein n=1 Tax=Mesorhizobium sp. TaxID=1871066 RepID=UPI000FE982C6|nr:hypothetical protein [Mesorhizobium sp.]RWD47474.1 MAG: hypothetical protein EOS35_06425 [Mesorhizobium sp.]TIU09374.1 MAG: hypothetical protein E5W39_03080 [Mesorhizobium sp.]
MPAGLKIINDAQTIQIDETYKNLALIYTGTITVWTSVTFGSSDVQCYTASLTMPGSCPILAFTSTGGANVLHRYNNGNGTFTFDLIAIAHPEPPPVLNYYVFDLPSQLPPISDGLVVRSASNEIVFQSNGKPLKPIDFKQETSNTGDTTYTYDATKTYAVIPNGNPFKTQLIFIPVTTGRFYTPGTGGVGSKVGTFVGFAGGASFTPAFIDTAIIIVDVTNY